MAEQPLESPVTATSSLPSGIPKSDNLKLNSSKKDHQKKLKHRKKLPTEEDIQRDIERLENELQIHMKESEELSKISDELTTKLIKRSKKLNELNSKIHRVIKLGVQKRTSQQNSHVDQHDVGNDGVKMPMYTEEEPAKALSKKSKKEKAKHVEVADDEPMAAAEANGGASESGAVKKKKKKCKLEEQEQTQDSEPINAVKRVDPEQNGKRKKSKNKKSKDVETVDDEPVAAAEANGDDIPDGVKTLMVTEEELAKALSKKSKKKKSKDVEAADDEANGGASETETIEKKKKKKRKLEEQEQTQDSEPTNGVNGGVDPEQYGRAKKKRKKGENKKSKDVETVDDEPVAAAEANGGASETETAEKKKTKKRKLEQLEQTQDSEPTKGVKGGVDPEQNGTAKKKKKSKPAEDLQTASEVKKKSESKDT